MTGSVAIFFFFFFFTERSVKNSNSMDLSDHVREEIVESVDILDILTGLRKHNILDNKDQENIYQASDRTQSKNYEVLFEIIKTKGDKAFWAFCHSLKNKAPVIYSNLHDISNVNARHDCAICIEEDGYFKCQYCLGKSFIRVKTFTCICYIAIK